MTTTKPNNDGCYDCSEYEHHGDFACEQCDKEFCKVCSDVLIEGECQRCNRMAEWADKRRSDKHRD